MYDLICNLPSYKPGEIEVIMLFRVAVPGANSISCSASSSHKHVIVGERSVLAERTGNISWDGQGVGKPEVLKLADCRASNRERCLSHVLESLERGNILLPGLL